MDVGIGLLMCMLGVAGICYAAFLGERQTRRLAVRQLPAAEREAIERHIREIEHALERLYGIGHKPRRRTNFP